MADDGADGRRGRPTSGRRGDHAANLAPAVRAGAEPARARSAPAVHAGGHGPAAGHAPAHRPGRSAGRGGRVGPAHRPFRSTAVRTATGRATAAARPSPPGALGRPLAAWPAPPCAWTRPRSATSSIRRCPDLGVVEAWDQVILPVLIGDRRAVRGHPAIHRGRAPDLAVGHRSARRGAATAQRALPRVLLAAADEEQHTLPLEALAAALAEVGVPAGCSAPGCPATALADAMARTGPGRGAWSQLRPDRPTRTQLRRVLAAPHRRSWSRRPAPAGRTELPAGVFAAQRTAWPTVRPARVPAAALIRCPVRFGRARRSRMLSKPQAGPDGATSPDCTCAMIAGLPSSSSGPGRRPFKAVARVRIPLGARQCTASRSARSCGAVGVLAALSRRRSRVQVPSGPPACIVHGQVAQLVRASD